jgi:hypothetical protein
MEGAAVGCACWFLVLLLASLYMSVARWTPTGTLDCCREHGC